MNRLSAATLDLLPAGVLTPTVRATPARIGIAHIGVGYFHRSHQAMYLDRLHATDPDWAICGIGVRAEDRALADALTAQDHLYSLTLFDGDGSTRSNVIGSIRDFVMVPDDPAAALRRLCDPQIRIVSLTITESGYVQDPANGRTAATDEGIRVDLAGGLGTPRTAFGLLVAALRARRAAGVAPFTVMSCDNIQMNGEVAQASVLAVARLVDAELAEWITEAVDFPSTMVDRITPRPTAAQRAHVEAELGLRDAALVVAEPFEQWVLEDRFRGGRPALERVGAVFVEDIAPYERMKLRLLNGAHQVIAYLGLLYGHRFVHEAVTDPRVAFWVDLYSRRVALPTVELPDGVDGEEYIRTLAGRFANPAIADTLERLATDSIDRIAKFVLPVLADAPTHALTRTTVAALIAAWVSALRATTSEVVLAGLPAQLRGGGDDMDVAEVWDALPGLHVGGDALRSQITDFCARMRADEGAAVLDALREELA